MPRAPDIKVTVQFDAIRVHINGVLHLQLARSKLLGVQSWVMRESTKFCIEFTMVGGVIVCDYDDVGKWRSILEQLDRML